MKLHVVHSVPVTEKFYEEEGPEDVTDQKKMFHLEISPAEACILLHEIGHARYELGNTLQAMLAHALVTCPDEEEICRCRLCLGEMFNEVPPLRIGVETSTR